jgi:choline dehydrogenase-like flavoprotein
VPDVVVAGAGSAGSIITRRLLHAGPTAMGVETHVPVTSSIMPSVPSGNTNAPSIMIGERACDVLTGDR